jgi:acyl carrier protein
VDDKQILDIVHQTAAEMMAAKGGAPSVPTSEHGSAAGTEGADSLTDWYGFSSIDALECLLLLERRLGITLADEDLSAEVLSSATALAGHIAALRSRELAQDPAPPSPRKRDAVPWVRRWPRRQAPRAGG